MFEFDGTLLHWRAATGVSDDPSVRESVKAMYPMVPTREWHAGRAILDRQISRIDDLETEPGLNAAYRCFTAKSGIAIPLMRGDVAIGALALGSRERGGFTKSQIELLKTFAEQAVIAISSAETYRNLHEALEQQTATTDVLEVINTSPGNLTPVFDAMLEKAMRLCGAAFGMLRRFDGEQMYTLATRGVPPAFAEYSARNALTPMLTTGPARALETGRPAQTMDITEGVGYPKWRTRCPRPRRLGRRAHNSPYTAFQRSDPGRPLQCLPPGGARIHRQADRAAGELRRAGGDRDGECAAADRATGGARAADCDCGSVAGDQREPRGRPVPARLRSCAVPPEAGPTGMFAGLKTTLTCIPGPSVITTLPPISFRQPAILQNTENNPMSQDLFAVVVAALVFLSGIGGLVYQTWDPRNEEVNETRDLINRLTGLVATLSTLVLGLLIASANTFYNSQKTGLETVSARVLALDGVLRRYGPDAKRPARR